MTAVAELPGGLQSTQDGYTLALGDSIATADPNVALQFRILSPTGAPVKRYVAGSREAAAPDRRAQ